MIELLLNYLNKFPFELKFLTPFIIAACMGVLSYMLLKKKDWKMSLVVTVMSFLYIYLGVDMAYPLMLMPMIYFIWKINADKGSLLQNIIIGAVLLTLSVYFKFDWRYILLIFSVMLIINISISKNIGKEYLLLSIIFVLLILCNVDGLFYLTPLLFLLENDILDIDNKDIITWSNFKKYYLKKVINYKYIVISLYCSGSNSMNSNELNEFSNFLSYVKNEGLSIMYDDTTYILAYSDIKTSFGSSKSKVSSDNDSMMDSAEDSVKRRLVYPIISSTGKIYECKVERCDNVNEIEPTIKAMKNMQSKSTSAKLKNVKM